MGELLVLLVCWKSRTYGVPDQQEDTFDLNLLTDPWKSIILFISKQVYCSRFGKNKFSQLWQ